MDSPEPDYQTPNEDRISELEAKLFSLRELLMGQEDKNCLGIGYPTSPDDCAPWPIVDEVIDSITRVLNTKKCTKRES